MIKLSDLLNKNMNKTNTKTKAQPRTCGSLERVVRFPGLTLTGKEVEKIVEMFEYLSSHVRIGRGYCVMDEIGGYRLFKKLKKHVGKEI